MLNERLYIAQPQWEERIAGNGWYSEKWATPYMAAVARVAFRATGPVPLSLYSPDVTLTPQLAPERIIERLGPGGYVPLALGPIGLPDPELYPQLNSGTAQYYAGLGAAPELTEWFKKNRILVIVVIVALVLLFFFLRKGRR